jgi:hypothetical protein
VTSPVAAGTWSVRVAATPRQMIDATAFQTVHPSVLVATTGNITLSGPQSIDGVGVGGGAQRVLVKDQTAPAENGIWVASVGGWSRAADMDTWAEVLGALVSVQSGTVNGGSKWVGPVTPTEGTLGTTAVTFSPIGTGSAVLDPDLVWAPGVSGITGVVVA